MKKQDLSNLRENNESKQIKSGWGKLTALQ
jgi:hypothetical protein